MNKYGYVRVSTRDQNPERQIVAMEEKGIFISGSFDLRPFFSIRPL